MALKKAIRQDDGVTTNYHRILYYTQRLNHHTSIVVLSYVDGESRATEDASTQPYQRAVTYEFPYVPDLTAEAAYNLIKSLPQFEGTTDV